MRKHYAFEGPEDFACLLASKAVSNFDLTLKATDAKCLCGTAEVRTLFKKVGLTDITWELVLAMAELNIF